MDQAKKAEVAIAILSLVIAEREIKLSRIRRDIGRIASDLGYKKDEIEEVAKEALHNAIELSLKLGKKKNKA